MEKKVSLWSLFFVVFLDLLGIGIIIPILPLVFYETSLLPTGTSTATIDILLGLLIASYPFAQFFGAPILGAVADKHGRKPVLLLSLAGAALGYGLFGLGLVIGSVPLLFFSRMLAGFMAGNLAVVKAIIADISDMKSRVKNFGMIGMAFGMGFILGPFLGGVLVNSNLVSWFNPSTPFWFATLLLIVNIAFVHFSIKETLVTPSHIRITPWTGFTNIRRAFSMPTVNVLFLSFFLWIFGFSFFSQFFPVYLHDKYGATPSQIGMIFAYIGIWIAFAQGVVVRPFAKRFRPASILKFTILFISIIVLSMIFPTKLWMLYFIFPFMALNNGLTHPNFSALFSSHATKDSQGEIMGIEQSLTSLAMTIPAVIAGFAISFGTSLVLILGSFFIFLAWLVFVLKYKETREKFSEV